MKAPFPLILIFLFALIQNSSLFSRGFNPPKLYIHTDRDYYFQGDSIWYKAYYLDGQTQQLISGAFSLYVELIDQEGVGIVHQNLLLDHGKSQGKIILPENLKPGRYILRGFTDELRKMGEDAFFHKTLELISVESRKKRTQDKSYIKAPELDVAFLPEGGFLLEGRMNTLGVKALDEQGLGISFRGEILDAKGGLVSNFETSHKGFGTCRFIPLPGESYYCSIQGFPGFSYEFKDIIREGMKMEFAGESDGKLVFKACTNAEAFLGREYHFAILHGGTTLYQKKFVQNSKEFVIRVSPDVLPAGINRFLLLDHQLLPLSERLYFSSDVDINKLRIPGVKKRYQPRSKVRIEILDSEECRKESVSELSLAVIDAHTVGEDGPEINLLSWMLLESELKGYIESPSEFFIDDESMSSKEKLDLLMLTQGWSRYHRQPLHNHGIPEAKSSAGISLEGQVRNAFTGSLLSNSRVGMKIYQLDRFISAESRTDSRGRFRFDSIIFSDTGMVFLQAWNKRGKLNTVIELDSIFEESPEISEIYLPVSRNDVSGRHALYENQHYMQMDLNSYLLESGAIILDGVTLVGEKTDEFDDGHVRMYGEPIDLKSQKITNKDVGYRNIIEYLQGRVAGVMVNGDEVLIRGVASFYGSSEPLFLLDGIAVPLSVLKSVPMSSIDVVEVLKNPGSTAVFGSRGGNGIISVLTKKGAVWEEASTPPPGTYSATLHGYEPQKEFYSPVYTPDNIHSERPDHRLTMYWNPELITSQGKATVTFFTSDNLSHYRIFVEGITTSGRICLGTAEFEVSKD